MKKSLLFVAALVGAVLTTGCGWMSCNKKTEVAAETKPVETTPAEESAAE